MRIRRWSCGGLAPITAVGVQTCKDLCGTQAGHKGREGKGEWRGVR